MSDIFGYTPEWFDVDEETEEDEDNEYTCFPE